MTCVIELIAISALWLGLWAVREYEQRKVFQAIVERNEALEVADRERRLEVVALRNNEQKYLETIKGIDALFQKAQREGIFNLSGKASLPAAAEASNGQQNSVRVTSQPGSQAKAVSGSLQ